VLAAAAGVIVSSVITSLRLAPAEHARLLPQPRAQEAEHDRLILRRRSDGEIADASLDRTSPADAIATFDARRAVSGRDESVRRPATSLPRNSIPEAERATLLRETYAELFEQLKLSEQEIERFVQLVDTLWYGFAPEQGDGASQPRSLTDQVRSVQAELLALLGHEKFLEYEEYGRSLGMRSEVASFNAALQRTGVPPLSAAQERQLLQAISEERSAMPPPRMTGDRAAFVNEGRDAAALYRSRLVERSQSILSDQQLAVLRAKYERSAGLTPGVSASSERQGGTASTLNPYR
jgi:hypothetical protein